jgi:antitoxin component YwqK of YwqJK toxin-antitoxin module
MKASGSKYDTEGNLRNGPYQEHFKEGEKTGDWKYFLKNGRVKAFGRYAHDKMNGEWTWYRESGELWQTGAFDENEKRTGIWTRYHRNGQISDKGEYVHDKKSGEWHVYDETGTVTKTTRHKG